MGQLQQVETLLGIKTLLEEQAKQLQEYQQEQKIYQQEQAKQQQEQTKLLHMISQRLGIAPPTQPHVSPPPQQQEVQQQQHGTQSTLPIQQPTGASSSRRVPIKPIQQPTGASLPMQPRQPQPQEMGILPMQPRQPQPQEMGFLPMQPRQFQPQVALGISHDVQQWYLPQYYPNPQQQQQLQNWQYASDGRYGPSTGWR